MRSGTLYLFMIPSNKKQTYIKTSPLNTCSVKYKHGFNVSIILCSDSIISLFFHQFTPKHPSHCSPTTLLFSLFHRRFKKTDRYWFVMNHLIVKRKSLTSLISTCEKNDQSKKKKKNLVKRQWNVLCCLKLVRFGDKPKFNCNLFVEVQHT